ncbi:RND family transporter [Mycobacterium sp. TY813]|uniref:MMPL/RND family transporter n=1 Tax=Mycobacterium TaxID=1763 RepID=UPI0027424C58|nr:RND family transporter [Mycobacterium sp. TY813]MDP7731159.1 RND family transporter [Mycobacterium sp. TY813]
MCSSRGRFQTTGIFPRLARLVVRWPWACVVFWVALAAVLSVTLSPLTQVIRERTEEILPRDAPVMVASRQMTAAFREPDSQNMALVVLTNEQGLTPADEGVYRSLVDRLRTDARDVASVHDFIATPALRDVMTSKDHKAWFIPVGVAGQLGSPRSNEAYSRIAETARETVSGSTLTANMTGIAATVSELADIGERDMRVIEITTIAMVLLILFVVYRNVVTMLLPLLTIGVSLVSAQQVVSGLAGVGLGISQQTVVFMTAMMVGAGVDYAVFLISRYHENLRRGMASDAAVAAAITSIGKVVAASAATVAVTFLAMTFTRLQVFSTVGPALAISISIAFLAAMTLLPALLVLAGRRGWAAPRRDHTSRLWRRSGIHIVRRPVAHLVGSLLVLAALAACVPLLRSNYDARTTLPPSAQSNVGYAAMDRHFPPSSITPQYIFVRSPHDLRDTKALADLEQMAQRVSQLPDIEMVRGVTRPTGEPLEQAKLSWQAGEIGRRLSDASSRIAGAGGDLDALTSGARQLADQLTAVHNQVSQAIGRISGLLGELTRMQEQLSGSRPPTDVNAILAQADSVLAGLEASPACHADQVCSNAREQLQRLVALRDNNFGRGVSTQQLRTLLGSAVQTLRALNPTQLQQQLAGLEQGANALANGSQRIAAGVRALTDQTKQLGGSLAEASELLLSMKNNASQPGMSGFYVPPQAMTSSDFQAMASAFVSPDGHSVRYLVQSKLEPFDSKAMDQTTAIADTARSAQSNTSLSDASIAMTGMTPIYTEMRDYYNHDLRFIVVMTIAIVLLILAVLLRAIVAPLYLIATVVISYLSALGIGVIAFQLIGGQDLAWSVPGMAFIVLVAVGADYNLLLISRIRDESPRGLRSGVIRTVGTTGGVITSAGLIFAASMFGMLFGSISTMVQAGFIIGAGLLLDTFLVRTVTVPALAVLMGRGNWWPSRPPPPEKSISTANALRAETQRT